MSSSASPPALFPSSSQAKSPLPLRFSAFPPRLRGEKTRATYTSPSIYRALTEDTDVMKRGCGKGRFAQSAMAVELTAQKKVRFDTSFWCRRRVTKFVTPSAGCCSPYPTRPSSRDGAEHCEWCGLQGGRRCVFHHGATETTEKKKSLLFGEEREDGGHGEEEDLLVGKRAGESIFDNCTIIEYSCTESVVLYSSFCILLFRSPGAAAPRHDGIQDFITCSSAIIVVKYRRGGL